MKEEKKCPECRKKEKVKNGFIKGKQRCECKCCGCNYTGGKNGYPEYIKLKVIKYYLKVKIIERLMSVSMFPSVCFFIIGKPYTYTVKLIAGLDLFL